MPEQADLKGSLKARGKVFNPWGAAVLLLAPPPHPPPFMQTTVPLIHIPDNFCQFPVAFPPDLHQNLLGKMTQVMY